MARLLILSGVVLVATGLLWPWLSRLGLGHLPGDISIRGRRFSFYFPIATSLLVSAVLSLVLWLLNRRR
jgi:hypothetical protein